MKKPRVIYNKKLEKKLEVFIGSPCDYMEIGDLIIITKKDCDFEFLYGIRRDLSEKMKNDGYRVRLYVPFGKQWLPYTLRRLKEFKNLKFVIFNIFREFFSKRP